MPKAPWPLATRRRAPLCWPVNDISLLKGVVNVPDTELKGSASSYAAEVPNHEKFLVHFFARDCDAIDGLTDGQCTTVTERMVPPAGDDETPGDPHCTGCSALPCAPTSSPGASAARTRPCS